MVFNQTILLKLYYTRANGPDPDDDVEESMGHGGVSSAYASLKGSRTSMDWPGGSSIMPFDAYFPNGNNLLTDSASDEYGVRSWHMSAEPSQIPGKLQIAYYLYSNSDDSAPDSVVDFDLDAGAWDTGSLFVHAGDFSSDYYRTPRYRFIPGPLVGPLGV